MPETKALALALEEPEAVEDEVKETEESIEEEIREETEERPGREILQDKRGKFLWISEVPMGKSFFLLFEVWKVLGISAAVVWLTMVVTGLLNGNGLGSYAMAFTAVGIGFGILLVLSIPAYYIVTKANNDVYTVLFEMDDSGIDHIQIKTEKAKALDLLTVFLGSAAKNRTTTAAGILSATGGSLYSRFSKVKKIRAYPKKGLITLSGALFRNQVYVDEENFEYVYDYITRRCPDADVR